MFNIVHIDEKWFYMIRKDENFYLHSQEEEPLLTIQSKNFIGKVVHRAFEEYPARKVNHVFLTLQLYMKEIIKMNSCSRYKLLHIGKGRLECEGHLPLQIDIDPHLVEAATAFLRAQ
ncbi:hypothetical protein LIER_16739 [Lithospermum erythrorhizon]|uniref:Uncharacterized protein n=1 Tax=Lithospermum erythrorhizon TaxID=34254 RepID=A0AAV3Q7T3_LITER